MRFYELALNLSPQLEEIEVERLLSEIEKLLKKRGGELKDKLPFQKIKLAYPLKKQGGPSFVTSFLASLTFSLPEEKINDLEDELKHHSDILRYILVKKKILRELKKAPLVKPQKKLKQEPKIETKQPLLEKKVEKKASRPKRKKLKLEDIDKSLEKLLEQEL